MKTFSFWGKPSIVYIINALYKYVTGNIIFPPLISSTYIAKASAFVRFGEDHKKLMLNDQNDQMLDWIWLLFIASLQADCSADFHSLEIRFEVINYIQNPKSRI